MKPLLWKGKAVQVRIQEAVLFSTQRVELSAAPCYLQSLRRLVCYP